MTCETANVLVHFARNDLAADDQAALTEHLAGCAACTSLASRHAAEDAAIAAAMKNVTVPVGFRDSLQTQAIATQNAIGRATWLRRFSTLAAAIVALTLGFAAYTSFSRQTLDSDRLLAEFERVGVSSGSTAFEEWRTGEGLPPLPEDFDLQKLRFTGHQPLQGVQVPAARFRAGPGQEAVVYFVRDSQFRLDGVQDAIGSQGSVRLYRGQPGGWTIVIVHTGATLAPFLHQPGSSI